MEQPCEEESEMERPTSLSRGSSFSSFAEAILPTMQTTKEVWRKPQLHRDIAVPAADMDTRYNSHRGETWYELFYDLVFVAGAIQIGNFMKYDISIWGLFKSGIIFAVLRSTWDQLMFYQNKFDTKDILHYFYYLVQASCAFMMAMHLSTDNHKWDREDDLKSFAIAAVVSRVVHCLMYLQVIIMSKRYRRQFILLGIFQVISSILFAISAMISEHNDTYVWLWAAAVFIERSFTFGVISCVVPRRNQAPPHFGHLSHRQATFILLILGEAIIVLVQSNTDPNHDTNYYMRGLMGFGLVFNLGDVYYQQQVVGKLAFLEAPKTKPLALWTALHLLLSMSILYFAVGLKLVFNDDDVEGRVEKYEYLLSWSASATLNLIFFIRMTHKGVTYKGKRQRWFSYFFRFAISILCAIVPAFTKKALATIGILFAFSTLLVLQDLFSHRGLREDSLHIRPSDYDSFGHRETGDSSRLARVDNGLSTGTGNTDSFFFQDESFGRDKYLMERRNSRQSNDSAVGSDDVTVDRNPQMFGEKSRFFSTSTSHVQEPLLHQPSS